MGGWIKLYRDIKDHWIWEKDNRFKWWIDILLTVNHKDTKILIGNKLIECKRGQSVMSLETWAKRWNVTKKTVKDFFELLQKDSMLVHENLQISTRITVCNYDRYQSEVNDQETDSKRLVNGQETDATPKQERKERKRSIKNEKKYVAPLIENVISYFSENGYTEEAAKRAFQYYESGDWKDSQGKQVKNWKGKMIAVWFKPENKIKEERSQNYRGYLDGKE